MLAVLVVLGGSLSVFAETKPTRALIYGALVNATTTTSRGAVVYRVNDSDFALKPTADMSAVYQISLFFVVPVNVQTFSLSIGCLDSGLSQINDGTFSTSTYLYKWENNSASEQTALSGVKRNKSTVDGIGTYTWEYYSSTSTTRNCIMVNLPLNITVVDDSNFYKFRVNYLNVNGEAIGEVDVADQVSQINQTIQDSSTFYESSSEIPSPDTSHIGDGGSFASSALNEKLGLFDISGAVQRTLVPLGTYLFTPNSFDDSSAGHTAIVAISTVSMCVLVIVWIINSLHRSRGWVE